MAASAALLLASTSVAQTCLPDSITLDVSHDGNGNGGVAVISLWLSDNRLADAPANSAGSPISVGVREDNSNENPVTIVLTPSEEAVELSSNMIEPSYYVALSSDVSDVTYTSDGPTFGLRPGDRAQFVVTGKANGGTISNDAAAEEDESEGSQEGHSGCSSISDSITLDVLHDGNGGGGKAVVYLWLTDATLADASATLADSITIDVREGEDSSATVVLTPGEEAVESSVSMNEPEYYVALDVADSDVTYSSGPTFGLSPGDRTQIVLTGKSSLATAESTVPVAKTAANSGGQAHHHKIHHAMLPFLLSLLFFFA